MHTPAPVRTALLLTAALTLITAGCGSSSSPSTPAETALEHAQQRIDNDNYQGAHDALLHAMQDDPSSTDLFDGTLEIVKQLNGTGHPEAQSIAEDLLSRLDLMIPRLSLDEQNNRRKKLTDAWTRIDNATRNTTNTTSDTANASGPTNPLASVDRTLERVNTADHLRPELKLQLIRQAADRLDSNVLNAWQTNQLNTGDANNTWAQYNQRLEAARTAAQTARFHRRMNAFNDLREEIEAFTANQLDPAITLGNLSRWPRLNDRTATYTRKLNRWNRELASYTVTADVDESDLAPVKQATNQLTWAYSRAALDWINHVNDQDLTEGWWGTGTSLKQEQLSDVTAQLPDSAGMKDAIRFITERRGQDGSPGKVEAMTKLLLLNLVDQDRLIPYVRRNYEENWEKYEENLDKPGRLLAAKLRVLGGLQ